ncbi:MAG: hypothetical protein KF713_15845 [Turneriella sp.]|nr:hypothetical protein [Turneriella sp.]
MMLATGGHLLDGFSQPGFETYSAFRFGGSMKKISALAICFALMSFSVTFAKSKAKSRSSKSSGSSSSSAKPAHNNTSTPKQDASKKQAASTDKDGKMRKNTKTYHCRLPDGSMNRDASQELCLKVGGQWVKY